MADTCAGCPAELSPRIPSRATHTTVWQCCVTKAVSEQWGGKQDLCPRDRWSSWHRGWPRIAVVQGLEGERMQAEAMRRLFPEAPEEL